MTAIESERLLIAERARADRANRLMEEVIAVLAHELKAPLHAILGWTDLMLARQDDRPLLARGLDVVARNARLQARLIADLLDTGRLASGRFRLDYQQVQLPSVVSSAVDMVWPGAAAKGISITEDLDRSMDHIDADPARLQQAFCNVLSNAVKYTPENGHIRVALQRNGVDAAVVVEDDGAGIVPAFLPYVFDRFQQGDGSATAPRGGLGLGLWIVRNVVELHGGTVRAESEGEGRGATFTFALPMRKAASSL